MMNHKRTQKPRLPLRLFIWAGIAYTLIVTFGAAVYPEAFEWRRVVVDAVLVLF